MTYATALVEQFFLCNLYFNLTGNAFISIFLVLSILFHTGFSFASAGMALSSQSVWASFTPTTVGAIACAVTDILIASCLCHKFWGMMQDCSQQTSTRSLLQRIMMLVVSSGAIVASNTLITIILLLTHSPAFQFFFACQGRVYALTLLGNFLVGTPFNAPSIAVETNPGTRMTTVVFRVACPENDPAGSLSYPLRNNRSSPNGPTCDDSSVYQYEERPDLKEIPFLHSKSPASA